jgi:hypothetical protein
MQRRGLILFAIALAMLARPLQLPAASCILVNAPSEKRCRMDCCANKSCCAKPKESATPLSQPLHRTDSVKQQQVIGFVSVSPIDLPKTDVSAGFTHAEILSRAHAPPPLAASCIRLI